MREHMIYIRSYLVAGRLVFLLSKQSLNKFISIGV